MYGIQPAEPWVYSVTMALLITIGLLSSVGPTLRAMRIDPVETSDGSSLSRRRRPTRRAIKAGVDGAYLSICYLPMTGIDTRALDRELKKGSAELLILSLLDARPRHG